ncbi:ProQ/FINO family protein [Zooshikella ganghwensis]|uniref:ProQ/FINO family protein n=1 Tax=Zooshikella ganghwensis TaxID=202772 RepID=UPI001058A2AF|nr:ProQ/FINO family protein [Zooshikella ganghwensis]
MAKKPTVTVKKRRRVVVPPPIEVDTPPAAEVAKTELKIKKADPVSYKSRKTAKQILAILADEFPAVFAAEPKPLKSGFTQDYSSTRLTPREWKRGLPRG